jgi:hypothetical protein
MSASRITLLTVDRGVKVIKVDALAPKSDALFPTCFVCLETTSPRSSNKIASLLAEKGNMGKIKKKMKEYLRRKSKKRVVSQERHPQLIDGWFSSFELSVSEILVSLVVFPCDVRF